MCEKNSQWTDAKKVHCEFFSNGYIAHEAFVRLL